MIMKAIKIKTKKSKFKTGLINQKVKKQILFAEGLLKN